jgi:c-di-GMP-binding flagellar brake protein YcgR
MIILLIEILVVLVLVLILYTIISDERKKRMRDMRTIKVKECWDGSNRRLVDRFNITLKVKYYPNGTALQAETSDISTKGIKLLLDEKFERGTPLRLEINLPNEPHIIRVSGEVVWTDEALEDEKLSSKRLFNTGIKFAKFHDSDDKKLFDFIYGLQSQKSKHGQPPKSRAG